MSWRLEGGYPPKIIDTGIWGPLPQGSMGLILGRSNWTLRGLIIHPGVIDEDYTGEIKLMASLKEGVLSLQPKIPVAQLVLIPRWVTNNPHVKSHRGDQGFGSTNAYWMKIISQDKPLLTLYVPLGGSLTQELTYH